MEEITGISLGLGFGRVGERATFLAPELYGGDEKTKKIQQAAIDIYGKGSFLIKKIIKNSMVENEYLVHLDIPHDRIIIMPSDSLAEVT